MSESGTSLNEKRQRMEALYGENKIITDGNYDRSLAVRCINGTFVGRRFDETFGKLLRRMWIQFAKTGNPSLSAEISPDGKAYEWPLYDLENKYVMVFDEFNIHPEKEAERQIVDWDRTYFLTKYYMI